MPNGGATKVLEIELPGPAKPMYYAKDPSIQYGVDKNPSNYVAMIPVKTGLAFIDMSAIVGGFASGQNYLPASTASIVTYNNGGTARTMGHGGDYAIGASYASSTTTNGIAIINVRTRTVQYLNNVAPGASKFLWAPIFNDEVINAVQKLSSVVNANTTQLVGMVQALQAQVASLKMASTNTNDDKATRDKAFNGIVIGSVALAISGIAAILSLIVLFKPANSGNVLTNLASP